MKKLFLIITLFMASSVTLFSQTVYLDAIELNKLGYKDTDGKISFKLDDTVAISKILKKYCSDARYYNSLIFAFYSNPFIKLPALTIQSPQDPHSLSGFKGGFEAISSIGGLNVTNIADGFARFLVKRTKEELNVAFFTKFKEAISDSTYRDLQTVFPQTYRALLVIGDGIYNYEAYLQTLRESFENDLSNLMTNLPTVIDNHEPFFKKYPQLAASLLSSCYIAGQLADNTHPGKIIADYPADYLNDLNLNWKGSIQTIQLISESLRTSSGNDSVYWVSGSKIKDLVKDPVAFRIYLGLLYQVAIIKYDSIKFQKTNLCLVLKSVAEKYDSVFIPYRDYIVKFAGKTDKLTSLIKNHKKPSSDSMAVEQYYQYFKSSINLLEFATEAGKLPYVKLEHLKDTLSLYFDVAYTTGDLVLDVNRRNYASAVTNAVHIYDLIYAKYGKARLEYVEANWVTKRTHKKEEKIYAQASRVLEQTDNVQFKNNFLESKQLIKRYNENFHVEITPTTFNNDDIGKYKQRLDLEIKKYLKLDTIFNNQKSMKEESSQSQESLKYLFKYGTFMATIVQAKSSDDVEKAIEASALPSGSSRIKRETPLNVSLNAYTGLFVAHEKIVGMTDKHLVNNYGVAAPIGVAISTSCHHWSYTAFLSLVDIGAVASFRFQNTDSVSQIPTIKLQDIVSPGIFFSLGFPKCPLSFNVGAQMGPNLRNVYVKQGDEYVNSYQNSVYWRFSASLVVDIPIWNLYTTSKK
jgi:hypothetical protein